MESNVEELEECGICGDILNSSTIITKCNHKYHYDCIVMSFSTSKQVRECPYCRGDAGYLTLPADTIPLIHIHKEYVHFNKTVNKIKKINKSVSKILYVQSLVEQEHCKAIFGSGKLKGKSCTHISKAGNNGYCGLHKKLASNTNF